jgi:ankyrin repeat protein
MKSLFPTALLLLSAVIFISCGKKAPTDGAPKKSGNSEMNVPERLFEARKELRRAVTANDTVALRAVYFDNPDLSLNNYLEDGDTLLTYSIKKKFPLIRNILLDLGARPDLVTQHIDYFDFTPLMLAAHLGDLGAIAALLESRASLNVQDETLGDTALHKAIKNGYTDAAKSLIRAGASLQLENFAKETPMETAENLGRKEISDFLGGLVELGRGAPSIAVFRQILLDGDIVNYRKLVTKNREVIQEYATINPIVIVLDSPNEINAFEIVQSLLALKLSVNGPENAETTPLIRAVTLKRTNIAELLLRHNPDLQRLDKHDRPALYYAITNNDEKMVEFLLNNGALEKFGKRRQGRKILFKGCKVADVHQNSLKTPAEQRKNRLIQSLLGCRWTG